MIRFLFLILFGLIGALYSPFNLFYLKILTGVIILIILFLASFIIIRLRPSAGRSLLTGMVGLLLGLLCGKLFFSVFHIPYGLESVGILIFVFVGAVLGYDYGTSLIFHEPFIQENVEENANFIKNKILDTSTIIDGRILDISKTGYLEGIYLIPRFVLQELQLLSDSSDSQKRMRGRRGMELVNKMQKSKDILVQIIDRDFPEIPHVDNKLINLAKEINGAIVTTDFNLMKTAQIQGIKTFNINQLAEALKPVIMPGQIMEVFIVKTGKEPSQGVGYLNDGTMIVVENANRFVGKKKKIEVTSVIQTETGRMIFGKVS